AKMNEQLQHPNPGEETAQIAIGRYRKVYTKVINAQRQLLEQLNRKAEIDETLIRKYTGMLDLEEEKMRILFGKIEEE
ncbi:MAG: hypothetical protein JST39_14050, partial [Bacteroidetes bacterium]|nr:hypothetical protein [Bacteroidota bacterium]